MGESRVRIDWASGRWSHAPAAVVADGESVLVTAVEGSDAWRETSYGFVHDSEHALLAPLPTDRAVEVSFVADYDQQFDQAGVFLRASATTWVKAGVECADGVLQVGAVVTAPKSDWSVAPVAEWQGRAVTIRVSRSGDALTIRARVDDEPLRLVRVVPLAPDAELEAGPFTCAPTRAGLTVRFLSWEVGPADDALH